VTHTKEDFSHAQEFQLN